MIGLLSATILTAVEIPAQWAGWLDKGLTVGGVILILISGARGAWVFGYIYKESIAREATIAKDRDDWRTLALRATGTGERLVQYREQHDDEPRRSRESRDR